MKRRQPVSPSPKRGAAAIVPPAGGEVGFRLVVLAALAYYAVFIHRTSFSIGATRYFSLFDDAMISMRFARHLAQGHGLVWNLGEPPIEGFTNPLWTLLMAGIHVLPLAPHQMSLVVQAVGAGLLALNLHFVRKLATVLGDGGGGAALGAVILTAFYFPLVNWTLQGMEVGLLALITTAAAWVALSRRGPWSLYALLGIGTLVRLDYVTVLAAICVWCAVTDQERRWLHARLGLATAAIFVGGQTLARYLYFGDLLPNAYYLKLTGYPLGLRLTRGAWVLLQFIARSQWIPVLLPFGLLPFLERRVRTRLALPLGVFATQCLYSVWVGGDAWEEESVCNRFVAIAMPLVLVADAWAISWLVARMPRLGVRARQASAAMLLVATVLAASPPARLLLLVAPPYVDKNTQFVALALAARKAMADDARVAAAATGAIGYYSERWVVDLLGKCDRHIARIPMRRAVTQNPLTYFYPGHLKWDYAYSIGRLEPDAVLQLWEYASEARPYLERDYVRCRVAIEGGMAEMALRRESKRVRWDAVQRVGARER